MKNVRAIFAAYRGGQPNAEGVLRRIADDREMTFEELCADLTHLYGPDGHGLTIRGSETTTEQPTTSELIIYADSLPHKILFIRTIQTAVGWRRGIEITLVRSPTATRRYTFQGLTLPEKLYASELIDYYVTDWQNQLVFNRLAIKGPRGMLPLHQTAKLLGIEKNELQKLILGFTFMYIEKNNITPPDVPNIPEKRTLKYDILLDNWDIKTLARPVAYERRMR